MLIWKMAWRNIWRHKGKSLIIGAILMFGALVMTLGYAVIEGSQQQIKENAMNRFTGHLVAVAEKETMRDLFFAPHPLRDIPNYLPVKAILEQQKDLIADMLPLAKGSVMVLNDEGKSGSMSVFGVDMAEYLRFTNQNVAAVEGKLLAPGERGVLISDETRKRIFETQRFWVTPEGAKLDPAQLTPEARKRFDAGQLIVKHELVMVGMSKYSLQNDIRLPVKGVFRYRQLNKLFAVHNFMDIESYREAFGLITAANKATALPEEDQAILDASQEDIFGEGDIISETDTSATYDLATVQAETRRAELKATTGVNLDNGVYTFVLLKLKPGISPEEGQTRMNKIFSDAKSGVKTLTWLESLGEFGLIDAIARGSVAFFVMAVFFVAVIIIMNTLSMAALERTSEIGMMRAVGAQKSFIGGMFLMETAQLSGIFGGAGIVAGILLTWIFIALRISVANNEVFSVLLGGDTFHPIVNAQGILIGIAQLAIATLFAVAYPILVARKITPLQAIAKD